MATDKDSDTYVVKSSEETFDACCSPCTEAGKTKEAKTFCVDCGSSFCDDCLLDHNKFPSLRSHQILDKSGKGKSKKEESDTTLPTERCGIHHGKLIDMFCGNHDEVCCAVCIALKHRACVNVEYLPDIAQGINDSTELKDTLHSLQNVLSKMKQEIENFKGNLASLGQEKDYCLEEVDKYECELIQRIKELVEAAKQQICSRHEEFEKTIQLDIDTLDTVIATTTTSLQKLSSKNEAQLFTTVKTSKKSVKDCETMLLDMSSGQTKKELKFALNVELKDKLTTLGSIPAADEDIKEYKATLYGKYKVASGHTAITGACAMEDGTYVISVHSNCQLKRLDRSFTVTEQITVGKRPFSLFRVGRNDVAVILADGTIQFVSVEQNMTLTTVLNTGGILNGSVSHIEKDELFIFKDDQHLYVHNKSGEMLKAYKNNDIGKYAIKQPKQAAISSDNNTLLLGNEYKGLLALSMEGRTLWTFTDPDLKTAWGVCVLPGDITLVSGEGSDNVFQVDKNGKKIGMLLGPSAKMSQPLALAFDKGTSRLVVGCGSKEIHVYTLSKIAK